MKRETALYWKEQLDSGKLVFAFHIEDMSPPHWVRIVSITDNEKYIYATTAKNNSIPMYDEDWEEKDTDEYCSQYSFVVFEIPKSILGDLTEKEYCERAEKTEY